eukprot:TRINITY_DN21729_c0_g1_i1.p1 TRINITY_DN21729_c0_g1~~TRINITY_DN21729_c0_g1_i1.p1  ORF type:complete len:221 (-),score=37.87 TRINITY_DN21729_c0_g1_i1:13-675(-)
MTTVKSLTNPSQAGFLHFKRDGSWSKFYFVLHETILYYFKKKSDKKPIGQIRIIASSSVTSTTEPKKKHAFSMSSGSDYTFAATSSDGAVDWIGAINTTIVKEKKLQEERERRKALEDLVVNNVHYNIMPARTPSISSSSPSSYGSVREQPTYQRDSLPAFFLKPESNPGPASSSSSESRTSLSSSTGASMSRPTMNRMPVRSNNNTGVIATIRWKGDYY